MEELNALFFSVANRLSISEEEAERVIRKLSGSGLTVARLADGSVDHTVLYQYGICQVEDATLILETARNMAKRDVNHFPSAVEGHPRGTLMILRQSSDSFDGLTGNEPLDIRTLSLLLASVYDWENLGVKMGIPMQKLQEIRQQYHGNLEMCKNKLYDLWLRQTTEPSWRDIVSALEQIEENSLADRIRRLFPQTDYDMQYRSSQFSAYDSPTLSHIPRSSSVGSEPGHNPAPNVVMVPVAVTVAAAVVSPLATNPVPSLVNMPPAAISTVPPTASCLPPVFTPSVHMHHQGATAKQLPSSYVSSHAALPSKSSEPDTQLVDLLRTMTIEDPQQIDISCKVYNADSNKLIESTKPSSSSLTRDIRMTRRRVQEFSSSAVPVGTNIRLEIAADCECYMYILNIGTSGKIAMLLPNEFDSNHFCPNQSYHLPDPEFGFEIEGPPGKETLQVFAFSQKQSSLEGFLERTIQEKELYRDIVMRRKTKVLEDKKGFSQVQFDVQ